MRRAESDPGPFSAGRSTSRLDSLRRHRRLHGAADDLCGGLDRYAPSGYLALEEVQQRGELARGDGIGAALFAEAVKDEVHPAAAVGLGVLDVQFEGGELGRLLRLGGVRVA